MTDSPIQPIPTLDDLREAVSRSIVANDNVHAATQSGIGLSGAVSEYDACIARILEINDRRLVAALRDVPTAFNELDGES